MNNCRALLDEAIEQVMRAMWVILNFSALRLFGTVCLWSLDAASAVGAYTDYPEMLEQLLAGAVITLALGVGFQYIALCERS